MLDALVERAGNGRKRREPFDHSVAATHGLAIDDRFAVLVADRPGREIAVPVGERLVELPPHSVLAVGQNAVSRRAFHRAVIPFLRRVFGEAGVLHGTAGGTARTHGGRTCPWNLSAMCYHR